MVVYRTLSAVFPPIFKNRLKLNMTGYTPGGTVLSGTSYARIDVGAAFQPFNSGQLVTAAVGSNGFSMNLTGGSSVTQNPAGFSEMARLYSRYLVEDFNLIVRIRPTNAADVVTAMMGATTSDNPQTSAISAGGVMGMNQVVLKTIQLSQPGNMDLVLKRSSWIAMGLTKPQWEDLPFSLTNANPSQFPIVNMNMFLQNNGTLVGNLAIEFELVLDVQWAGPIFTNLEN